MSDAASLQQVCLFWAKPECLEQGPEMIECASEVDSYQAVDGQYFKQCSLSDLLNNALWSSAEDKIGWRYTSSPFLPLWCACRNLMFTLVDLIKIVVANYSKTMFWSN
jgi:hypothetical protein